MSLEDGPAHFATIAKSAKDFIYKGFVGGHMLSVACLGPCGTTITSSATIAHDITIGAMTASMSEGKRKHELSFSTLNNQVSGTTTFIDAFLPGMQVAVSSSMPGAINNGCINVQYMNAYAALSAKMHGIKDRPEVEVAMNLGSQTTFAGGRLILDTRTRQLEDSQVGCGYRCEATTATFFYDPLVDECFPLKHKLEHTSLA